MKLHVLANPRNPTGLMNRVDPFAVKAYKYIDQLRNRFEVIHYGIPGAQVNCEHVDLPIKTPPDKEQLEKFARLAGEEIRKRKNPGDIIACFFGLENKLACDMNPDCIPVEPSIGYRANAIFAPYRVFTSYAQMHMFYGERGMLMNPSWFDEVIPNPFTVSEFEFSEKKEDFFLFFGRVIEEKGIHLAIQATEKLGVKLVVAGPGSLSSLGYKQTPNHVECIGPADAETRKDLMKHAKGLLGLTYYVEPFGNMTIEANLSGTPAITTDWGGFTENVIEGKTGYRVRNFRELIDAMKNIESIKPIDCRNHGLNYSDEAVHDRHYEYLLRVKRNDFYDE